jgi:hypothetical protein
MLYIFGVLITILALFVPMSLVSAILPEQDNDSLMAVEK